MDLAARQQQLFDNLLSSFWPMIENLYTTIWDAGSGMLMLVLILVATFKIIDLLSDVDSDRISKINSSSTAKKIKKMENEEEEYRKWSQRQEKQDSFARRYRIEHNK